MAESSIEINPPAVAGTGPYMRALEVSPPGAPDAPELQEVVTQADAEGHLLDGSGRIQVAYPPSVVTDGGTATAPAGSAGRVVTLEVVNPGGSPIAFTWTGGPADGTAFTVRPGSVLNWTPGTEQTATSLTFPAGLDAIVEWA